MASHHIWSEEEKEYLKDIVSGRSYVEIQELMNNKFEYQFTINKIKCAIKRYKLNTGRTGKFKKGAIPFNKGTKGLMKPNKTSFNKDSIPLNKRPVGSERIKVDGYTEVKVAEPRKWKLKHRLLYEKYHNVKLKPGEIIIFLDQDKNNFNIDNLEKITQKQLLQLNKNNLIKDNPEVTKAGINIANILIKLNELKK